MPSSERPLSALVDDLRRGLAKSTELMAENITLGLKKRGPYWTGQFEGAWEVSAGSVRIASSLQDQATWEQIINGPQFGPITPVPFIPPANPDVIEGYTIVNLMEYADIAMDLEPGDDGRYRYERPRKTADRDWFERYLLGGDANKDIKLAVDKGMSSAGFQ